jgi:hypothetical protein
VNALRIPLVTAALAGAFVAAAPVGAATHDCAQDVLRAAQKGAVGAYFPPKCYLAASVTNAGGNAATSKRLQTGLQRDAKRKLFGRITGVDLVHSGSVLRLHLKMTMPVQGMRIRVTSVDSLGRHGVATTYLTGTSSTLFIHPATRGQMVLRIQLGFLLKGKLFGAKTTKPLVINVI